MMGSELQGYSSRFRSHRRTSKAPASPWKLCGHAGAALSTVILKLVAFTDYVYRRRDGAIYAERAFALFLTALGDRFDELTIVGRLDDGPGPTHYPLPAHVQFVALPHYKSLSRPLSVAGSLVRSLDRFWRALDTADRVWLLGPYPHAVAFAVITLIRRRVLVLGVRQDFPSYVRSRRPRRRWMHIAADALELAWITLGGAVLRR
jgi:hypothetical protein